MKTDTSERGLESLIVAAMVERGWIAGASVDYNRDYALDLVQLQAFLVATQPDTASRLDLLNDTPALRKFLARLQGEITKRGVIDVLRKGVRDNAIMLDLFYGAPSADGSVAKSETVG